MQRVLIDVPETEYLDGRPYRKVSPKRIHAIVQFAAAAALKRCAAGRGTVGPEWRFRLAPGTQLVPDIAYVSYDRLRPLPADELEEPPFAPDVAVEVRSPSHRAVLLEEKIRMYLAHGGLAVLDVDPALRTVSVHTAPATSLFRENERVVVDPLPWLTFAVGELFVDLEIPNR